MKRTHKKHNIKKNTRRKKRGGLLDQATFETCAKSHDNEITCPITLETLTPEKAVKPPSTTNQCFDSDVFLHHLLRGSETHPLTREPIDSDWILNTYPDEFVRDSYTQGAARPWTIEEYAEHVKMADNLVDALEFAVYELTEVRDPDENVQSRLYAHHKNLNEALGLVMSEIDTHVHYYNRPKVYERILNDEDNAFDKLNDANDLLSFVREKRNRLYSNAYSPTPSIGGRTRRKRRKRRKRTRRHK